MFGAIPDTRNCQDADVADGICVCRTQTELLSDHPVAVQAARVVLAHINHLLKDHSALCNKLNLSRILSAHQLSAGAPKKISFNDTLVTIETRPGLAKFEATIRTYKDKKPTVLGDMSRTNLYGHTADCVTDSTLRNYCYCIKQPG